MSTANMSNNNNSNEEQLAVAPSFSVVQRDAKAPIVDDVSFEELTIYRDKVIEDVPGLKELLSHLRDKERLIKLNINNSPSFTVKLKLKPIFEARRALHTLVIDIANCIAHKKTDKANDIINILLQAVLIYTHRYSVEGPALEIMRLSALPEAESADALLKMFSTNNNTNNDTDDVGTHDNSSISTTENEQ